MHSTLAGVFYFLFLHHLYAYLMKVSTECFGRIAEQTRQRLGSVFSLMPHFETLKKLRVYNPVMGQKKMACDQAEGRPFF
jgi:hypothetical protein